MKIIDKIQIRYFRSIKDQTIKDLKDLNIFSGINDSGKSNILKALNLFFQEKTDFDKELNFKDDFSQERLAEARKISIKSRQFIAVKIYFIAPDGHKNLPHKFFVEKTWDRDGNILNITDNVISQFKKGKTRAKTERTIKQALSRFINSIHYEYIPAVRSSRIFDSLLGLLQDLIISRQKGNKTVANLLKSVNIESGKLTDNISRDFEKVAGIKSSIRVPTEFQDFFKSFFIDTETGDLSIPLRLRGDGIQMRYIPSILDYISRHSREFVIWGFDEPENSTEYSLCNDMAQQFKEVFSKNAQIFVSTHSFSFTTLSGESISKYRVFKDENNINSKVILLSDHVDLFSESESHKINEELGILHFHEGIASEYKQWQSEKDKWLTEFEKLKSQIPDDAKPILFVEGKTDKKIIEVAWSKLFSGKAIPINVVEAFDCYFIKNTFSRGDIFKNYPNRLFISIFDFDSAYKDCWKKLLENESFEEIVSRKTSEGLVIKHKNEKGYSCLLPVPISRKTYADVNFDTNYLCIELLFDDNLLTSCIEEIDIAGGGKILKIKDSKKTDFASKVENFKKDTFKNFQPLFQVINDIIDNKL